MRWALTFLILGLPGSLQAAPTPAPAPEPPSSVVATRLGGQPAIVITGSIQDETEAAFAIALAASPRRPRVYLDSPGGLVMPGLAIGRLIRANGLDTVVAEGAACYSTCGLIWLAGAERYLGQGARVGFHAASTRTARTRGAGTVSSTCNAVIGSYLGRLGFSDNAIGFFTFARPSQILEVNRLRPQELAELGITYRPGMPPPAGAAPRPIADAALPGLWEGRFRCGRDVHAAKLFIWTEPAGYGASFEFGPTPDSPNLPYGAYEMRGQPLGDGRVGFRPGQVSVMPAGRSPLGLIGQVEEGTLRAELSGRRGCAPVTLRRAAR
ncbi:MAG: Periplasmic protein-like protein [Rubritepida sp.]|nr:Periplasmic protein-like protein [Rubritepida sp.]